MFPVKPSVARDGAGIRRSGQPNWFPCEVEGRVCRRQTNRHGPSACSPRSCCCAAEAPREIDVSRETSASAPLDGTRRLPTGTTDARTAVARDPAGPGLLTAEVGRRSDRRATAGRRTDGRHAGRRTLAPDTRRTSGGQRTRFANAAGRHPTGTGPPGTTERHRLTPDTGQTSNGRTDPIREHRHATRRVPDHRYDRETPPHP